MQCALWAGFTEKRGWFALVLFSKKLLYHFLLAFSFHIANVIRISPSSLSFVLLLGSIFGDYDLMVGLSGLLTLHDNVPVWLAKAKLSMVLLGFYIIVRGVCGFIVLLKILSVNLRLNC